jgi:hypothetical protein
MDKEIKQTIDTIIHMIDMHQLLNRKKKSIEKLQKSLSKQIYLIHGYMNEEYPNHFSYDLYKLSLDKWFRVHLSNNVEAQHKYMDTIIQFKNEIKKIRC